MTASNLITTHVLDSSTGLPAAGMEFELSTRLSAAEQWKVIASGVTDADGRSTVLALDGPLPAGTYCLRFATGLYYERRGVTTFYPAVTVEFSTATSAGRHHVPLILSPFGYSTYRGS
jgi:5-hydroxyisourate hydrolase